MYSARRRQYTTWQAGKIVNKRYCARRLYDRNVEKSLSYN